MATRTDHHTEGSARRQQHASRDAAGRGEAADASLRASRRRMLELLATASALGAAATLGARADGEQHDGAGREQKPIIWIGHA